MTLNGELLVQSPGVVQGTSGNLVDVEGGDVRVQVLTRARILRAGAGTLVTPRHPDTSLALADRSARTGAGFERSDGLSLAQ